MDVVRFSCDWGYLIYYGKLWSYIDGDLSVMSVRPKSTCENCAATYIVVHELPEDDYIEQFCPFCGEEHEDIEEDVLLNEDWD